MQVNYSKTYAVVKCNDLDAVVPLEVARITVTPYVGIRLDIIQPAEAYAQPIAKMISRARVLAMRLLGLQAKAYLLMGGGKIVVRNLPQLAAILPQFSVMPLFKNFTFVRGKFCSSLQCYQAPCACMSSHLSCLSFMWSDAFLFSCSKNVIHFWGS